MVFASIRWMRPSGTGSPTHGLNGAVHASVFERIHKSVPFLRPKTRIDMIPVRIGWKTEFLV